jgi:hypothetical protein
MYGLQVRTFSLSFLYAHAHLDTLVAVCLSVLLLSILEITEALATVYYWLALPHQAHLPHCLGVRLI